MVARRKDQRKRFEGIIDRLSTDFVYFCHALWKVMEYDKVAPIGPAEEQMMRWIAGEGDAPRRRGVLAPRGIGKTHIVLAYVAFRMNQRPELKALVLSKTELHAKDSVRLLRGWVDQVAWLGHLSPNRHIGHRDHALFFDIGLAKPRHRTPSVRAAGIDGQLEGMRSGLTIGDDIETDKNTMSLDMRFKLDTRVRELARVTTYQPGDIIFVGTFHTDDSVYLKLRDRGYAFQTWPIMIPSDDELYDDSGDLRIVNLAPALQGAMADGTMKAGNLVFPHRHNAKYIEDQRAEGADSWDMHQMLMVSTGSSKRYPLKLSDLITVEAIDKDLAPSRLAWGRTDSSHSTTEIDELPSMGMGDDAFHRPITFDRNDWVRYQQTKMFVDPSGKGADRTAYCVIGLLNSRLFVKELRSLPGGYDEETLGKIVMAAKRNRATTIVVEDEFGSGMMKPLLEERLRKLFQRGTSTAPSGDLSGPNAAYDARTHAADRMANRWGCVVETANVPKFKHKEDRILDVLEPVVGSHRLVIDFVLARDDRFQTQFTRIRRERGCLPEDDEVDALAGCCKLFSEQMDLDPDDADVRAETMIDAALHEMRTAKGMGRPSAAGWVIHT
jgi:hypothetical protein